MPLSFDPSLALRPDTGVSAREPAPARATPAQAEQFATALVRASRGPEGARAPTLVRATRTRLAGDEAARALRAAWTEVRGTPPSDETLSILVGQWAHETGRGASMLNFNFGGIKGTGPSGLCASYNTHEGFGESAVRVVDQFRAYESAEEGARDYVGLLARRYPDAVGAAERGDVQGFVRGLKARGYFTDNEATYMKSVQSLASRALNAGFGAIGCDAPKAASGGDADMLLAALDSGEAGGAQTFTAPGSILDGGALLGGDFGRDGLAAPAIAPGAFADEVNRAALLMSALRIAEPSSRRS